MENRNNSQLCFVSEQDISDDFVENLEISLDCVSVKLIQNDENAIHKCDECGG
jgi:hypothetical protein